MLERTHPLNLGQRNANHVSPAFLPSRELLWHAPNARRTPTLLYPAAQRARTARSVTKPPREAPLAVFVMELSPLLDVLNVLQVNTRDHSRVNLATLDREALGGPSTRVPSAARERFLLTTTIRPARKSARNAVSVRLESSVLLVLHSAWIAQRAHRQPPWLQFALPVRKERMLPQDLRDARTALPESPQALGLDFALCVRQDTTLIRRPLRAQAVELDGFSTPRFRRALTVRQGSTTTRLGPPSVPLVRPESTPQRLEPLLALIAAQGNTPPRLPSNAFLVPRERLQTRVPLVASIAIPALTALPVPRSALRARLASTRLSLVLRHAPNVQKGTTALKDRLIPVSSSAA